MRTGIDRSITGRQEHTPSIPGYDILATVASNSLQSLYTARHVATGSVGEISIYYRPLDMEAKPWKSLCGQYKSLLRNQQLLKQNRNIQSVLDFGETHEMFYVVSEPVEGRTLQELLALEGPLPLERLLPILKQVGSALDYAASYKLYHTALTPDRIVVSNDGERAYITEFALARFCRLPGSPYTAPEQLSRTDDHSRPDMYSLGAILYTCLCGNPPFTGATDEEIRQNIIHGTPRFLLNQPFYVREIIKRMMMRLPEQRYATFIDVMTDLEHQRCPAVPKQANPNELALDLKLNNLQFDGEAVVDVVIANPPRVTSPGFLVYKIQVFWRALRARFAFRRPKRDAPARRALRKRRKAGEVEDEPEPMSLWALLVAVFQSSLTGVSYRHRQPTENPAVYNQNKTWLRAKKILFRAFRRACTALTLVLIVIVCHSAILLNQKSKSQRYATVHRIDVRKSEGQRAVRATVVVHGKQLPVGDQLEMASGSAITTGSEMVTLEMPDVLLRIAPNSEIHITQETGIQGTELKFDLASGQMWADLAMPPSLADQLEIGHEDQTVQAQGTKAQFSVAVNTEGTKMTAYAYKGDLRATNGLQRRKVKEGYKLSMTRGHRLGEPDALSEEDNNANDSVFASLDDYFKPSPLPLIQLYSAYQNMQETTVEPVVSKGMTLAHLMPDEQKWLNDAAIQLKVSQTLVALGISLYNGGDPPANLTLTTLEEIGLSEEDRKNWLNSFDGHRVLYYKRHEEGKYTLYVRAPDSNRTLWKLENNSSFKIDEKDEDKELAKLSSE